MLEGGDIEIIASDVEEDLGEGKLEWFEKIWELPSEKQRFSIRSWKFLEKRKKKNQRSGSPGGRSGFYPWSCYCL